jgi:DNA helicase-2/ATP-dependent DNA helicase PcrA
MEEERRLCYVGMTRAREELHLLTASSRLLYGSRQYNPPSRFLADIDGAASITPSAAVNDFGASTEPFLDEPQYVPEDMELVVGDKVRHKVFGPGKVIAIDGMNLSISFGDRGVKKLNGAFAPLERM